MPDGPADALPYRELEDAYKELIASLRHAYETFNTESDVEGCKLACQSVARFISMRHEPPELAVPFLQVFMAFVDVERGVDPELFSRDKGPRPRSRSGSRKHLQMWAAVCAEVLFRLNEDLKAATRTVARYVGKWAHMQDDKISETTIRNWRDALHNPEDPRHSQFSLIINDIERRERAQQFVMDVLRNGPPDMPRP